MLDYIQYVYISISLSIYIYIYICISLSLYIYIYIFIVVLIEPCDLGAQGLAELGPELLHSLTQVGLETGDLHPRLVAINLYVLYCIRV